MKQLEFDPEMLLAQSSETFKSKPQQDMLGPGLRNGMSYQP